MYINTITISSRGQIVLPAKVRAILNSSIISLEVLDGNKIIMAPVRDLGGSLAKYSKKTNLSWEKIREKSWQKSIPLKEYNKDPD